MDTVMIILGGLSAVVQYLLLFFIPGFFISLVFYPRFSDLGLFRRLVGSVILSISSGIASLAFLLVVKGADTEPGTIILGLEMFSALLFVVWLGERGYLGSRAPAGLHQKISFRNREPWTYISTFLNSRRDRFAQTAMTRVVWHKSVPSGTNHVDHTYLIDVGDVIDIQLVDENQWKFSDGGLLPPPYPKTRNFELFIKEFREEGASLIDDLQVYPVRVTRKPGTAVLGRTIRRGPLVITERFYKKTDTAEIQWIYTHDFHLFAILYSQDTLGEMVDRILRKLDEIASSIHKGSRVSSHVEDTQKLRDEFETVVQVPEVSTRPGETPIQRDKPGAVMDKPVVSYTVEDTRIQRDKPGAVMDKPVVPYTVEDTRIHRDEQGTTAHAPKVFSREEDARKSRVGPRIVFDKPRTVPTITEVPVKNPAPVFSRPIDSDRRKLQADIVRDLRVDQVTPGTFRSDDRMITSIKIPDRTDLQKILLSIREIQNDVWLYE